MLGVNQGIIMVLAVVVIGGLVGSGALGDEVAVGSSATSSAQGVVASLAILALGIALDRVTPATRAHAEGSTSERDAPGRRRWYVEKVALGSACPDRAGRAHS